MMQRSNDKILKSYMFATFGVNNKFNKTINQVDNTNSDLYINLALKHFK
jgi:hypothetical protein